MLDIELFAKIHASPDRVYRALTTADGIRSWWAREASVARVEGIEEPGHFEHRILTRIRLDELQPAVRTRWKTILSASPGWAGTTITFDLRAEGSCTFLSLVHSGFTDDGETYARTAALWARYLLSLHRYVEAGEGRPTLAA
ncbi:MAG TPA: SRPBCC domain-containing protein [Thermoanaerobaculia bacterium]